MKKAYLGIVHTMQYHFQITNANIRSSIPKTEPRIQLLFLSQDESFARTFYPYLTESYASHAFGGLMIIRDIFLGETCNDLHCRKKNKSQEKCLQS